MPFVAILNTTGIKVLGTKFSVDQRNSTSVIIRNIEGSIKFYELTDESNSITLKKGEIFSYDIITGKDSNDWWDYPSPLDNGFCAWEGRARARLLAPAFFNPASRRLSLWMLV